jgi:hypothetical protein
VVKPALTDIIQAYLYNRLTEHDPSECHDVLVVEGALGIDSVAERRVCEDLVVLRCLRNGFNRCSALVRRACYI